MWDPTKCCGSKMRNALTFSAKTLKRNNSTLYCSVNIIYLPVDLKPCRRQPQLCYQVAKQSISLWDFNLLKYYFAVWTNFDFSDWCKIAPVWLLLFSASTWHSVLGDRNTSTPIIHCILDRSVSNYVSQQSISFHPPCFPKKCERGPPKTNPCSCADLTSVKNTDFRAVSCSDLSWLDIKSDHLILPDS